MLPFSIVAQKSHQSKCSLDNKNKNQNSTFGKSSHLAFAKENVHKFCLFACFYISVLESFSFSFGQFSRNVISMAKILMIWALEKKIIINVCFKY